MSHPAPAPAMTMRELSLFSGAGGGLLGTHLLGWSPIGYVEFNDYCQRVIAQRIADGILPVAPIFGDVREFVESGAAAEYRGFADVVTAGFPCQPFSVAGKRAGTDDERNMWPATIATIRAVRPRFALLENVPGLIATRYFDVVIGELAESGYDCRWRVLSAAELGAPHKRDRLWIVAADAGCAEWRSPTQIREHQVEWWDALPARRQQSADGFTDLCAPMADAEVEGLPSGISHTRDTQARQSRLKQSDWWEAEPALGRVVDGYAGRVDELKAIGNAQVASVVRAAWHLLTEGI